MDEKASSPNNPKSSNQTIDSEETLLTFDDYADAAQSEYNQNTVESTDSTAVTSSQDIANNESSDSVERVRRRVSKRQKRKELAKQKKRHPIVKILLTLFVLVGLAAGGFI